MDFCDMIIQINIFNYIFFFLHLWKKCHIINIKHNIINIKHHQKVPFMLLFKLFFSSLLKCYLAWYQLNWSENIQYVYALKIL